MNHNPWERELERCYATFDERHTQLRDELQTKLAERKSLHIHTEIRGRVAVTGLLRPSFVLAACLVVVVVAWLTSPLGIPRPAYGLDDLPKPTAIEEMARGWHPYCSVASWYLWRSLETNAAL